MIVECCSQERSYSKFYGLIGERLCKIREIWSVSFDQAFRTYFETIHRYETNRLRNIGRFFGHLLATDAISWSVFDSMAMNEEETTSSSRIFIKILMQELVEGLGLPGVKKRFLEPSMQGSFQRMFPLDNPKNTRFAIKCVRSPFLYADWAQYWRTASGLRSAWASLPRICENTSRTRQRAFAASAG